MSSTYWSIRLPVDRHYLSRGSRQNFAASPGMVEGRLNLVKFSGPEENTMRRAMSRDCASYDAWSISDTSGHALNV